MLLWIIVMNTMWRVGAKNLLGTNADMEFVKKNSATGVFEPKKSPLKNAHFATFANFHHKWVNGLKRD